MKVTSEPLRLAESAAPLLNDSPESLPLLPPKPTQSATATPSREAWAVFASTFATIFLAEIGDKTQVTTLLMTAESHHPWIVFAGAGTALITTSLLGVLLGQWLATRIAPKTLEKAAGASLLLIAAMLAWDVLL